MDKDFESDKFDECFSCKLRFEENICSGCSYGEDYEEDDMEEVDAHFKGRI